MATASTVDCSLMFLSGLRGYHEYRAVWTPQLNEVLPTIHERTNPHDRYAIAARKRLTGCIGESTVGHLPKEISQVTRFIMLYGAVVTVKVLDTHHRSPLVQGPGPGNFHPSYSRPGVGIHVQTGELMVFQDQEK